jgi:Segregation and condensation complex subunit ScpB
MLRRLRAGRCWKSVAQRAVLVSDPAALAEVILASRVVAPPPIELSPVEQLVLTVVAYFQPVTRMQQVADIHGKPVSRDAIAALRSFGLVAIGPRSPQPGAPYTYVLFMLDEFGNVGRFSVCRKLPTSRLFLPLPDDARLPWS